MPPVGFRTYFCIAATVGGFGVSRAPAPPCPSVPWQRAHCCLINRALPFAAFCACAAAAPRTTPNKVNFRTLFTIGSLTALRDYVNQIRLAAFGCRDAACDGGS